MSNNTRRKPTAFRVEEVEVFVPPEPVRSEEPPLPAPQVRAVPDLKRGLKWGSIFLGALGLRLGLMGYQECIETARLASQV